MKMIMKLLILLLVLTNTSWAAGNSVFLQQQNQTNSSTFIKQEGANNKVGISVDDPFIVDGNNITIIINQLGNSNTFIKPYNNSGGEFYGTNMTLDYLVTGDSNTIKIDQDDVDSTGHWYDLDITGDSNVLEFENANNDVLNLNVDLDVRGDSNDIYFEVLENNHFLYVLITGDSNIVKFKAHDGAVGQNSTANATVGPNTTSHGQLAADDLATIDYYIIGNSNQVELEVAGNSNYSVHDVIGNSNILDLHADAPSGYTMMAQIGANNWLRTITNGDSNDINILQNGNDNRLYVSVATSGSTINAKQTGNSNNGNLYISGDSIYDYTLNFAQNGSDSCTYSFNRNNQSADVTATVSNGC
jgi:hypothetical protein